jgi:uncharacterized membrane protein
MSLASLAHQIQSIGFLTAIRESSYVYPIIMTTHLISIALFGGMILMTDLRLLGLAMRSHSISDLVGRLRVWKRIGFAVIVTCGVLLATSEADKYVANPYFWIKMTLLALVGVHAVVFHRGVYHNTAELDHAPALPGQAKLAGLLSLLLWMGIVCAGRWIGYYEPKRETSRVMVAPAHPTLLRIGER